MKYQINLIQQIRQKEVKDKAQKRAVVLFTVISFVVLAVAVAFTISNILNMKSTLDDAQQKLARVEAEYNKYKATKMIVDKADIELLDQLQTNRIFWTKKLAAMAYHLPHQAPNPYWITKFGYKGEKFNVQGYGFISPEQEQLITIDDYLNSLRKDSTFCDVFKSCFFNSTSRADDGAHERVTFDYSAMKTGAKR